MTEPVPVQFSVTRIGDETYRLIVQSASKIILTAIVEKKKIQEKIQDELEKLAIIKE